MLTSLCPDQQPWPPKRQSTGRLKPNTQSLFLDRTSRVNPYLPPYQRTPFSSQDIESSQFFLPVLCFLPTSFTPQKEHLLYLSVPTFACNLMYISLVACHTTKSSQVYNKVGVDSMDQTVRTPLTENGCYHLSVGARTNLNCSYSQFPVT